MLYQWKVTAYAYLVKVNRWDLEPVDGSEKPTVPEEYRVSVALYLTTGEIAV